MVWMVGSTKRLARVREEVGGDFICVLCAHWVCPTQPQVKEQRTFFTLSHRFTFFGGKKATEIEPGLSR